jgi:hypothetical protein
MKMTAVACVLVFAAGLTAAEVPSFKFELPKPPLSLQEAVKDPSGTNLRPFKFANPAPRREFVPSVPSRRERYDAGIRVIEPRDDTDFKLLIKEPDPSLDPRFVVPVEIKQSPRILSK